MRECDGTAKPLPYWRCLYREGHPGIRLRSFSLLIPFSCLRWGFFHLTDVSVEVVWESLIIVPGKRLNWEEAGNFQQSSKEKACEADVVGSVEIRMFGLLQQPLTVKWVPVDKVKCLKAAVKQQKAWKQKCWLDLEGSAWPNVPFDHQQSTFYQDQPCRSLRNQLNHVKFQFPACDVWCACLKLCLIKLEYFSHLQEEYIWLNKLPSQLSLLACDQLPILFSPAESIWY